MKKLVLMAALALFAFNVNAQDEDNGGDDGFSAELNVGLPIGDAGDFSSFSLTVNVRYSWEVANGLSVGPTTGYGHWFGKDNFGDLQYIPIAGNVEVDLSDKASAGIDAGYAINVGVGGGGDLYGTLRFSFDIAEDTEITASSANIFGSGTTWSNVQVGARLRF